VRPAAEILATLDEDSALEGQPFMPEMLQYVGKRFTVSKRIEKLCNNVDPALSPSRRLHATVHLDDLRCNGQAHGGCQMACRLFWKEEWLRPVDAESESAEVNGSADVRLQALSHVGTRAVRELDGEQVEVYRCQATEAIAASEPLNRFDPRQFAREVSVGNVSLVHLVWVIMRTIWFKALRLAHLRRMLPLRLPSNGRVAEAREPLRLRAGDFVQVRSKEEIAQTLDEQGRNRGLSFSPEMIRYCGRVFRVRNRVERLIDETSGKMIEISNDCLILDGAICPGEDGCWAYLFCQHGTYPFWREAWLRRLKLDPPPPSR
jgi:hypothetical protein